MPSVNSRPAAVAGLFYPADPARLRAVVTDLLRRPGDPPDVPPVALIVPHAGFVYSGSTAGTAFSLLASLPRQVRRAVLLGPAHRVAVRGVAAPSADAFTTPLGDVPVDVELRAAALRQPGVTLSDEAHALEHALEVQLPFLQAVMNEDLSVLPLVVGDAPVRQVQALIERLWQPEDTLFVISTDLSHFHSYETARRLDAATIARIERLDASLTPHQACGCRAVNGMLAFARQNGLQASSIYHCNSGDTAGDRERVVGYAAFAITPVSLSERA